MKSSRIVQGIIIVSLLWALGAPQWAAAQPESSSGAAITPLEVPPTPTLRAIPASRAAEEENRRIYFARPKLGLRLEYHFEEEERNESRDTLQEFRERLILETNGWVYNPALMKLKLRVEPELRQATVERDGDQVDDGSDDSTLAAYFAEARLLDPKPVSLRLYGQRRDTTLRSAFATSSDSQIDTYGADVFIKYRFLPTTLSYVHRDVEQEGFFDRQETQDQYSLITNHNTARSKTRLNATYSETESTQQDFTGTDVTNEVETLNSDLHNELILTRDKRVRLNSFWNYRTTDIGTFDTTDLRIRENLHWQHRDNFRTDYLAGYSQTEANDSEFQTVDLGARFTHLYKDALTTTGGLSYTGNEFDSGDEQIYRSQLDFVYRRPIEWGRMNLFAGGNYEVSTRNLDAGLLQVVDESQTLSTAAVTFLNNPNVDLTSVVVTNSNSTVIFTENVDYTLQQVGSQTRIIRSVLGAIADGETVLVDYRFNSDPSFDDTILRQRYGIEFFLFDALTLSYRYSQVDQTITRGPEPSSPSDEQVHSALARYSKPLYETRFSFEDSERDSGISTTQWQVEQVFRKQAGERLFGSVSAAYTDIYFKELDENEQVVSLRLRGEYLLRSWSRAYVEGFWENVTGDVREVVDSGIIAGIDFSYRIWRGGISYSYLDENDEANNDRRTRQTLQIELIRIPF